MIETIQVIDFLKTGNFGEGGEIYFGMARTRLLDLLGETDWFSHTSKKSKFPSLYKYGKVEFYFEEGEEGRLYGIQIKPSMDAAKMHNLKINDDSLPAELKFDEALEVLKSNSIKYELINFEYTADEDLPRIQTEGNVQFIFDESGIIEKVNKFIELSSNKIAIKQISISIPEAEYERLRNQSIESGISIQKICKKIILDKLQEN